VKGIESGGEDQKPPGAAMVLAAFLRLQFDATENRDAVQEETSGHV